MSTLTRTPTGTTPDVTTAVAQLVRFLETGEAAAGLFAPDCFTDLTVPLWRLQADTGEAGVALRRTGHPARSEVSVRRVDPIPGGFVMEFEERWEDGGQRWYSRELVRADVVGASIVDFTVYCAGDWDEAQQRQHAAEVTLLRP